MAWDKNWPEDAKTGPKFLQELMRRHPDSVQTIKTKEDVEKFFKPDEDKGDAKPS